MIQKINYADKQTGGKFSASDANEIKSTVNLNADVLSENSQSILSLQGGSLGSIKPTDAAPTPARNGNYTFSIGGNKPAWLTAEPLVTEVKAGDGVAVVYTEPSTYSYAHIKIDRIADIYNVTVEIPLSAGQYYTPTTARTAVPAIDRTKGKELTYETSAGVWVNEKFIGSDVANWDVDVNWENASKIIKDILLSTDSYDNNWLTTNTTGGQNNIYVNNNPILNNGILSKLYLNVTTAGTIVNIYIFSRSGTQFTQIDTFNVTCPLAGENVINVYSLNKSVLTGQYVGVKSNLSWKYSLSGGIGLWTINSGTLIGVLDAGLYVGYQWDIFINKVENITSDLAVIKPMLVVENQYDNNWLTTNTTGGQNNIYVNNNPILNDGILSKLYLNVTTAGTIVNIYIFSRSGTQFTQIDTFNVTCPLAGENVINVYSLNKSVLTGQYVGVKSNLSWKYSSSGGVGMWALNVSLVGTLNANMAIGYQWDIIENSIANLQTDVSALTTSANKIKSQILTVGINGDYLTINDALSANLDSSINHVIIDLLPGTYKEVVKPLGQRNISIVGRDREFCIIRDDTGYYVNSPIRISGNAYLANLTIIATHNDNPAWLPDSSNVSVANWPSYALHLDDVNNGSGIVHVHNCRLYSENAPAAGCGGQINQTLKFTNCELESNIPDAFYAASTKCHNGALFLHPKWDNAAVNQVFILNNCLIKSNRDEVFVTESASATNNINLKMSFYRNILYSATLGRSNLIFKNNTPESVITLDSWGNNITDMNK